MSKLLATLNLLHGTIPWGEQVVTWYKLTGKTFLSSKRQWFILRGTDTLSGDGFAFSACRSSHQHYYQGLLEYLTHLQRIPSWVSSYQGTHFTAKEVLECVHVQQFCHILYRKAVSLIKCYTVLRKEQLKCQLGGNTLKGWGAIC